VGGARSGIRREAIAVLAKRHFDVTSARSKVRRDLATMTKGVRRGVDPREIGSSVAAFFAKSGEYHKRGTEPLDSKVPRLGDSTCLLAETRCVDHVSRDYNTSIVPGEIQE
jgi:hypothetical protein